MLRELAEHLRPSIRASAWTNDEMWVCGSPVARQKGLNNMPAKMFIKSWPIRVSDTDMGFALFVTYFWIQKPFWQILDCEFESMIKVPSFQYISGLVFPHWGRFYGLFGLKKPGLLRSTVETRSPYRPKLALHSWWEEYSLSPPVNHRDTRKWVLFSQCVVPPKFEMLRNVEYPLPLHRHMIGDSWLDPTFKTSEKVK